MADGTLPATTSPDDRFFPDKESVVRLIIQHPVTKHILVTRYFSDKSDERFFYQNDDSEEGEVVNGLRKVQGVLSYWSFIGLPNFQILNGESSMAEPVKRLARRKLGIEIGDLALVYTSAFQGFKESIVDRVYFHTIDWSGDLHRDVNPEIIWSKFGAHDRQGTCEWVDPRCISEYVYHPEVVAALNQAHRQVDLLQGLSLREL